MNSYTLELENDQLLNIVPLVTFLKNNEGSDIELIVNQESHCLTWNKVYDLLDQFKFSSVRIMSINALEQHDKYQISNNYWYHWFIQSLNFDHNFDYAWDGTKTFGCFYGRPTASRLGIVSHLHKHYPDKSLIKVRFDTKNQDERRRFEFQKLYEWSADSLDSVVNFLSNIDQYTSEYHAYDYSTWQYDYSNHLNYLYKNIFVDLVVEAHLQGDSFYPTEKIVRAILCRKPFIVMAPVNYLAYLRQMGFRTFSELWSEEYDGVGSKTRYFSVIKLLDHLAGLPSVDLTNLNNKAKEIVEHNYQLSVSHTYKRTVKKIQ